VLRHVEEIGEQFGRHERFKAAQVAVRYVFAKGAQDASTHVHAIGVIVGNLASEVRRVGMLVSNNCRNGTL
jgi:hypothetical protein